MSCSSKTLLKLWLHVQFFHARIAHVTTSLLIPTQSTIVVNKREEFNTIYRIEHNAHGGLQHKQNIAKVHYLKGK